MISCPVETTLNSFDLLLKLELINNCTVIIYVVVNQESKKHNNHIHIQW